MPIENDCTVIQITPDLDPQNNIMGYVAALAYKAAYNPKVWGASVQLPGAEMWKHLIDVLIAKDDWHDQYKINEDFHVSISDLGEVTIKKLS